ncbi:MAG: spore cortex-lytic protein [Oscillospiraceae bacterium]|jgi:hypothetical protein|nr:spore cortex-lytic protein [Oscillospiraceae bacterium]
MAENGYLTVRAFTSNAVIPVAGVAIALTRTNTEGHTELLGSRFTNESGRIPPIPVPAPDLQESLRPGMENPNATVNLTASHIGYERIIVENVQIFPGVTTDQQLMLIPLGESLEPKNTTEVFIIPPQEL